MNIVNMYFYIIFSLGNYAYSVSPSLVITKILVPRLERTCCITNTDEKNVMYRTSHAGKQAKVRWQRQGTATVPVLGPAISLGSRKSSLLLCHHQCAASDPMATKNFKQVYEAYNLTNEDVD